jgi:hypothetical protein
LCQKARHVAPPLFAALGEKEKTIFDSKWLEALKLPTKVIAGIFIATIIILSFDKAGFLLLKEIHSTAKPLIILLSIFSGALLFSNLLALLIDCVKKINKKSEIEKLKQEKEQKQKEKQTKFRAEVISRLEYLETYELRLLADALKDNTPTFYTYVYSPPATTLIAKELIYTPGGTHNQDHYPFIIHDFVWAELLSRKAEIIERDKANLEKEKQENRRRR